MEANEEGEPMPEAPPEEVLPTEVKKEAPKKTKLLAAIIVVIVVIAALAAALGLGLFDGDEEETENSPPTAGARATTETNIDIGGSVTFESLAEDSDGNITNYAWYFGDGESESGADKDTVTHTYDYGGFYWVYHVVTDDGNATADNAASLIFVQVFLYDPAADGLTNESAPYAVLVTDKDVVEVDATVTFNMTSSYAVEWNETEEEAVGSWEFIDEMTLDFGDGSAAVDVTPAEMMTEEHAYAEPGNYAAKLTVTGSNGESTTVFRTVQVLEEAPTTTIVKNPDSFVMVSIGEPDSIDPATDYETAGGEVLQNVYETLVFYDGDSAADLVPVLAEEIPTVENGLVSEDGLNYTFNIRDGVTFHDGTDMDAEDVAYSVQRALRMHDPDGPSWMIEAIMTHYISFYVGGTIQDWIDSEGVTESWLLEALPADTGVEITEDHMTDIAEAVALADTVNNTVTFRLTTAYPAFMYICAYTLMDVVSKDYVEANGGIVNGEWNDHMRQHTCGSGPYMLKTWDVGSKVVLTRNDDYWGDAPALKDIYIVKANDVNTRILMLQAGDADSIYLPIDYEDLFEEDADYRIIKGLPTFNVMFAGFNWDINETAAATFGSDVPSDFFHDIHVRRAFTHLMDYDLFLENVLRGNGIQPNGAIPKGMFGYDDTIPKYEYSLAAAEAEFKLAINSDTSNSWWDDGFEIALIYNAGNTYRQTACELMEEALESMGTQFTVTISALDWPTYLAQLRNSPSPFPMFWLGWAPDYADPDNYMTPFLDSDFGAFPHTTGYVNESLNDLIRQAAVELDPDARADLYSEASMLVYEDVPYVWMYQANNFHIERSWVQGYFFNPMFSGYIYSNFDK